jgi:DNA-binding response OmpR family regulator
VALLVLDVIMPRLRGTDAYQRIQRMDASVPVIFCTGYSSETTLVETLSSHHVLHKPYPARELARMVRLLLDRRAAQKK